MDTSPTKASDFGGARGRHGRRGLTEEPNHAQREHPSEAGRVRKPRVHITYDVEVGDAIEKKELPFVVGVLADLSGNPKDPLAGSRTASSSRSTATTSTRSWQGSKPRLTFKAPEPARRRRQPAWRRAGVRATWTTSVPRRSRSRSSRSASWSKPAQRLNELALKLNSQRQARRTAAGRHPKHRRAQGTERRRRPKAMPPATEDKKNG